MNNKNISFFIPAYNCEGTITQSLYSIIKTNFNQGDELIIVNDCSTDGTENILIDLKAKYSFIKIIKHDYNRGGGSARNTAIKNANNSILFCLDSDNILARNSINKLKQYMLNNNYDVAAFQKIYFFKERPNLVTHKWIYEPNQISLDNYLCTYIVPGASGNYMFTKESWLNAGGYPEFAGASDTWGFGFRQLASGSKMGILKNTYYYHRYGHDSYWIRELKKANVSLRNLQIIMPYIDLINDEDAAYIMSSEHRETWFEFIEQHPIRIKGQDKFINSDAFISYNNSVAIREQIKKFLNYF